MATDKNGTMNAKPQGRRPVIIKSNDVEESGQPILLGVPGAPRQPQVSVHQHGEKIVGFDFYCVCGRHTEFAFD